MATLKDVVSQLQENVKETQAVNDNMSKLLQMELDRSKGDKVAAADAVAEARKVKAAPRPADRTQGNRPKDFAAGFSGGLGLGGGLGGGLLGAVRGIVPGLIGVTVGTVFGAGALAVLGKGIGTFVRKGLIFGVAYTLLEKFGKDAIESLFTQINEEGNFKIDPLVIEGISETTKNGLIDGLALGLIFGKKGFFAGFVGSVLIEGLKKTFPKNIPWEEKAKILGFEIPISNADFLQFGATMGAFFAPGLILGGIRKALGLGIAGGPKGAASGAAKTGFLKGFRPKGFKGLGWAGLLMFTGSLLADYVGEQTGNMVLGDLINMGVTGASITLTLASLFGLGPMGIAAGLVGFAIHGAILLRNYHRKRKAKMDAEFAKEVALEEQKLGLQLSSGMITEKGVVDQTILMAMANGGLGGDAGGAEEEAFIRQTEKIMPGIGEAALYLLNEMAVVKKDLDNAMAMGSVLAINQHKSTLMGLLQEMEALTGPNHAFFLQAQKLTDINSIKIPTPNKGLIPNVTIGEGLAISKPVRSDFNSWYKTKGREDRDFGEAMREYSKELQELLPPTGSGSGGVVINNFNNAGADGPAGGAKPGILTLGSEETPSRDTYYQHPLYGRTASQ